MPNLTSGTQFRNNAAALQISPANNALALLSGIAFRAPAAPLMILLAKAVDLEANGITQTRPAASQPQQPVAAVLRKNGTQSKNFAALILPAKPALALINGMRSRKYAAAVQM